LVIIVRAISVEKAEDTNERHYVDGVRSATMVVERVFKGSVKVRDELVFGQGGGADCIWTFNEKSVGEEFLFYLSRPEKTSTLPYLPSKEPNLWFAFGCGRSTGLEAATDDLLYLKNMAKVRGKTRISGTIGGWQNPDLNVEGKKIRIIGEKKTYETKTSKDGVFEIYDLPPGKYLIEPEMPPGWKIDPYWIRYSTSVVRNDYEEAELKSPKQVAIVLEPKKHAAVDIVFAIDNVIRGKVIAPDGKPMRGVCLYLWGREQVEGFGPSDCTDENGRFKIASIPAGQYVLVANRSGKLSSREPFDTFYYPSVSDRDKAAVITIGAGENENDMNLIVPAIKETLTLQGVVRYSDGKPAVEEWVKFTVSNPDKNISGDVSEQTDSNGRFSIKVLRGLTGELAAEQWLLEGLFENCPTVDELIKNSGRNNVTVKTNTINLGVDHNFFDLELVFPFPTCKKKEE